jgi:Pentapeptide repeats (8 copies)
MNAEELKSVLDAHLKWANGELNGGRADLRGADLQGAYLRGAYLRGADLQGAYLRGAYLRGADLRGADLQGAYLQGAYLQGAYLRGADLREAYLQGADLRGADLLGADLQGAYLQGAYLPMICKWLHGIIDQKIKIGCKVKSIEDWDKFFESDEVYETPRNDNDFKQIQAVYEAYKAYLTFINKP